MKILWLCNIMLPAIAESIGLPYSNREGWLTGIYERIVRQEQRQIELGICFPMEKLPEGLREKNGQFRVGEVSCYAFCENLAEPHVYDSRIENRLLEILDDFKPDMVHIFGTEFPHTLAMVRAFSRPDRTLIGIQGLCFACAKAYMADIPEYVQGQKTFRDRLKKDSIRRQQEKFAIRGEHEKEALRGTGHITGRTMFDRRETGKINQGAKYHFMNETMRSPFYTGQWERKNCIPHSIFVSQGDYPLKGLHYVLEAMPAIRQKYPDAAVYVAGNSIVSNDTLKDKIKISSYGKYIIELLNKNHLQDRVKFLGKLSAEEMKEQFLRSEVFICPSSLENSPNSMGEAMLLGVPVAAACTGGIPCMLENEQEGLLYEAGREDKLAEAVIRMWENPKMSGQWAKAGRMRAMEAHNPDKNYERLMEIYREICL